MRINCRGRSALLALEICKAKVKVGGVVLQNGRRGVVTDFKVTGVSGSRGECPGGVWVCGWVSQLSYCFVYEKKPKHWDQIGCFFLFLPVWGGGTHPQTPHWSCKEDGDSVMRTRAAETFRRMLPEIRNLLRSLWDVHVWQSTASHTDSSELQQTRWGLPQGPDFRGLCLCYSVPAIL